MSNLTTFVKQMLPDFVRTDHPMFETFIGAYYEYLESTNNGTSSSHLDFYKEMPNPVGIINNAESYLDIDETLLQFIDYFAATMVPTTIDTIRTDPRFFIKKTRDMYLAKGTPKSFELFFRIFFGEDIDVYETKKSILKTSDGKYFSFPVAHFLVTEFGEFLSEMDFSFATIGDSETTLGVILQGTVVDKDPSTEQNILKFIFSNEVDVELGKEYYVTDTANKRYKIAVKPLLSIENINVDNPGALYRTNDSIIFKTNTFRKNFISTISEVKSGKVDEVVIRNRGYLYKPGDLFRFNTDEESVGLGGSFSVTSIDSDGGILGIDSKPVRTGDNNQGWLSNSFQSAYVPVKSGGSWSKLPTTDYRPIISVDRSVDFDDTYLQSQGYGIGAQITPISTSIGRMNSLNFNQSPYFIDSDDVSVIVPTNIIVENIDNLFEGDIIDFRYWYENASGSLLDDSEEIIVTSRIYSNFYYIHGTSVDSELTTPTTVDLPYDFDSDTFKWISKDYTVYAYLGDSEMWQNYESDLVVSTLNNDRIYSFQVDNTLDGGTFAYPRIAMSNIIDGNLVYLVYYNDQYFYTQEDLSLVTDVDYSTLTPLGSNTFDGNSLAFDIDGDSDVEHFTFYDSDTIAIMFDSDFSVIEGGSTFDTVYTQENIDGGDSFNFSRSVYHEIKVRFKDRYISEMDPYHVEQLDSYNQYDQNAWIFWETDSELLANLTVLSEAGTWQSSGKYAQVVRIDDNVVQVIPYSNYDILSDSELKAYLNDKYDLVRIESVYKNDLSPKDEDYSPFQNVVHKIVSGSISFDYQIVSRKDKMFWDESGFLSSADKAILQDGYYYSDYTYNITSNVPYLDWKKPFKEMLHPAGMIVTATTVINSQVSANAETTVDAKYVGDKQKFSFDSMLEYGEDPRPYVFGENFQTSEDNIVHRIEKFNEANKELGLGWVVSSDDYNFAPNTGLRQQKGDSFWDYEPLGWVSDNSTQDSDGLGKVKSEIVRYEPSNKSRYSIEFPVILRTDFTLATDSDFDIIDSDTMVITGEAFVRFDDSDNTSFKKIDYSVFQYTSDNKSYNLYPANRKLEIAKIKMNDLNEASKENGSLVFTDKNGTYYDFDAYEKKWNQDNTRRFTHEAGWYADGYVSYYQNYFADQSDESRKSLDLNFMSDYVIKTTTPANKLTYEGGNTAWRNYYANTNEINTIEETSNTETYRDPKVSMKGRRG